MYSWTAISKPPYLTALALWPKGDGWGGGGIFDSELSVQLNHRPAEDMLAAGHRLKKGMRVNLYGAYPGRGEDFPIYHSVQLLNGWTLKDEGECGECSLTAKVSWLYRRPMIYEKPIQNGKYLLQMKIKGVHQQNDAWYWTDYDVLNAAGETLLHLPHTDWADWDSEEKLLFARDGKLCRLGKGGFSRYQDGNPSAAKEIADLNGLKFEAKAPPRKATVW